MSRPRRTRLRVERLEARDLPAVWSVASFDSDPAGSLPPDWRQWSSAGNAPYAVSTARAYQGPSALTVTGASNQTARAWLASPYPADFGASATILADSLEPVEVIARGSKLDTAQPTYYAASVFRGLQIDLVRVVDGAATTLATLKSRSYFSGKWVRITLQPQGDQLQAEVYDPTTNTYLNSAGLWQAQQTYALTARDATIAGNGLVGLGRPARYAGPSYIDNFSVIGPEIRESFDATPAGGLPSGWVQWTSDKGPSFAVAAGQSLSAPNALTSTGISTREADAWIDQRMPADLRVTSGIFLNSLIPAQLFLRGSGLGTPTASYYAARVSRGMQVELVRVVNGVVTSLGAVKSAAYTSQVWAQVTLVAEGDDLRVKVYRPDTKQYLDATGKWVAAETWAIQRTDGAVSGPGYVGLIRPGRYYADTLSFDDFQAAPLAGVPQPPPGPPADTTAPTVTITAPAPGTTWRGTASIRASATDNVGISRVEFWLGTTRLATLTSGPYTYDFGTTTLADGQYTLTAKAFDAAGNVGQASVSVAVRNATATPPLFPQPAVPQHYSWIRLASLAWYGTPLTDFEQRLLRESIDLVIPNENYQAAINAVSPATPKLLYTNVSNLYLNLLTDWLAYADRTGVNRENAFYHVAQATPFSGGSPSSIPVTYFWSVQLGTQNLTSASRDSRTSDVPFGAAGQSLAIGYTDRFREINVNLGTAAANGWTGVLEYVRAVDAAGNPTAWGTLPVLQDGTNGFRQSGRITFDPPADWRPARLNGSDALYFVRVRTLTGGAVPVASTILGRDYVQATYSGASASGIIPAFDYAADADHDGYLNDAEYARRASGKDARFVYESRLFYPYYGPMRFVTDPAGDGVRGWAIDYLTRYLAANPLAQGLWVDNSSGKPPVTGFNTLEPFASYTTDYADLLRAVAQAVAPRWLMANTAGGNATVTDPVARSVQATYEEFAIRALASTTAAFEDLAAAVKHRESLTSPAPYLVLDSHPAGDSAPGTTWAGPSPRLQIATLAYYYLIANPDTTFLQFFGGFEPNTSWTRHWSPAVTFDVGRPQGDWSVFATGADPANTALTYKVYQRSYGNALVLYKPLSYKLGTGTGTLADATATTHQLNGTYRPLQADGTLGAPVTSVTLRNGEGAILVKS